MKKVIALLVVLFLAVPLVGRAACRAGESGCPAVTQETTEEVSVLYVQTAAGSASMHDFGTRVDCEAAAGTIVATVPRTKKGAVQVTAFCLPVTVRTIMFGGYGAD